MTIFSLILSLLAPTTSNTKGTHYYDAMNPRLGNVTHCMYGKMTLKDNGMLVGDTGTENFHQLMADSEINGIPELTPIDATIQVCQSSGRLVYAVEVR